ncbi:MAG: hypothetical protein CSA76_05680 [Spirochaetales bacterium]|nr:MAG: hypothetical protein CSA76_05680 [Spirochaetales bacterium]
MDINPELQDDLLLSLKGMGLSLVELSVSRHRGNVQASIVLYKDGGISLDDLSAAQKTLRPRLELEYGRENLSLEISSPGISRKIKSINEYNIFKGRNIRLLIDEEWIDGRLAGLEGQDVLVNFGDKQERFSVNDIRKAQLQ